MARIDPIIGRLFSHQGVEAMFQTSATPVIRFLQGSTPVLKQALDTPQIVSAFAEIVPEHLRAAFPVEGSTKWTYAAPSGRVQVHFHKRQERVTATLRPCASGAEDEPVTEQLPQVVRAKPAAETASEPELIIEKDGPAMPIPVRAPKAAPAPAPVAAPDEADTQPNLRILRPQKEEPPRAIHGDPALAMQQLLSLMLEKKASDLHLASDTVPMLRVDGDMTQVPGWRALGAERLGQMLWSMAPERNRVEWEERSDTDFAYELPQARFRVNLFRDRRGIGAVLRHIPSTLRSAQELGLSKAIMELCSLNKGLVLVTGPTGSGKSTTLAAMIDHINRTRHDHIITIEDPIEFVHPNQKCLVNQREVGVHTQSFKQALRAALREDPDVILVGELRDLETISIAIETAETGHLVFGTLHTNTAPSTVDRIIDQFPSDRQAQIRTMLSESLKGVVAQTLCKRIGGGRVAAHEVLLVHSGVANMIREGKTFQLPSAMQTGRALGMATLNDALLELVKKNLIEPGHALQKALQRNELRANLERAGFKLEPEAQEGAAAAAAVA